MTLACAFATAHASAALSTISKITVYPGGATVERQIPIAAGSSRIEVTCLPASFDPQSLRLIAPPNVQLGDYRIEEEATGDEPSNERCASTSSDKRIGALQTQLADLNARAQAVELSAQYLKNASEQGVNTHSSASMPGVTRALQQSGFAVYAQRDQIKQQQDDVRRRLDALRGDVGGPAPTRTLRIALDAPRGGQLTLIYETQRAGWIPAYLANLDTSSGQVTLERRALVAQATGEDWRGVKLQLTTATPVQNMRTPQPRAWRLNLERPRRNNAEAPAPAMSPPPPAPMPDDRRDANTPLFAPTVVEGAFLTEFNIPGKVDVASDAQKVAFTLSRMSTSARLVARVIPSQSTRASLVAKADRPDGVWPDGNVQLRRDGALVGETPWSETVQGGALILPFGFDEQISTSRDDSPDSSGTVESSGSNVSQTLSARYTVRNHHRTSIDVEIVESTPVSESADIRVMSSFTPQPDDAAWQGHRGVVAWERTLAAGGQTRVGATYTVQYPADRTILGLP
ncbi:DUF4139 domain-containing protein [Paraburkholderia bannensis]|uniref:DUF4139 domain-containing protein n=1 Tax=Paraburkholderia bannensis TaxID=765414 RepID=UPI002AB76581|nr:DUF4139 domain-containing protein [Paraburkholderia bannensis]